MKQTINRFKTGTAVVAGSATSLFVTSLASAQTLKDEAKGAVDAVDGGATGSDLSSVIIDIVNVITFIAGAAAVIMIIIGALRYIFSGGDANATAGAKNTILYAVVGLAVSIGAYAIVNFVIDSI